MTIRNLYPDIEPTLLLDFAKVRALDPRVTFTRASSAVVIDENKVYREVTSGTPRFDHDPVTGESLGLLIEEQRTNGIRNPRFEGATPGVIGSGGVMPTHMSYTPIANHTLEVVGVTTLNGLPALELIFTAIGAGQSGMNFETVSGITLSGSTTYNISCFIALVSGSLTNFDFLGIRSRVDAGTAANGPLTSPVNLSSTIQRLSNTYTTAADATAGRMQFLWQTTGAATVRFLLAAPQFELGAFATSPILPPIGAPAQSTRAADSAIMSSTNFSSWYRQDQGTVFANYKSTSVISGATRRIVEISDGGITNRIILGYSGSTNSRLLIVSAGVNTVDINLTGVDRDLRAAYAYRANSYQHAAISTNFSSISAEVTTGNMPATNMDRMFIGSQDGTTSSTILNGTIRKIAYYPLRLPNTELQAITR